MVKSYVEVIIIKEIILKSFGRDVCKSTKARTKLIPDSNMIHFIESGCGYFNGKHLKKGQGFICLRNVLCDYIPDKNEPWTYSWININGEGATDLIKNLPLNDGVFEFDLTHNISAIKRITENKNPNTDEMRCLGILFEIFSRITKNENTENYVSQAMDFLKNNYHLGTTIDDCARHLNISRAYLRNLFYAKAGISPQQFLMNLKMERAEFLLKTAYPITEIAHAVGYNDVLQFSRIFSKYHNMSPKAYRKRLYENL